MLRRAPVHPLKLALLVFTASGLPLRAESGLDTDTPPIVVRELVADFCLWRAWLPSSSK